MRFIHTFGVLLVGCVVSALGRRLAGRHRIRAGARAPELELSPEGKKAIRELLVDLASIGPDTSFGVKKLSEQESLDEFLPKCQDHVQQLVKTVDAHYTDVQLQTVLTHECQLSQEFPHSHPSNFESHEACLKFAEKLTAARMEELETGKTEKYKQFCTEYYDEAVVAGKGEKKAPARKAKAAEPKPKPEPEKSAALPGPALGAVAFAMTLTGSLLL